MSAPMSDDAEAVVLLGAARNKVADFIDGVVPAPAPAVGDERGSQ